MHVNFPQYISFEEMGGKVHFLADNSLLKSKVWSLFNPSIGIDSKNNYAVVFKSSNFRLKFPSYTLMYTDISDKYDTSTSVILFKNYFAELDNDLKTLKNFSEIKFINFPFPIKRGIEDIRLFWRDSSWWLLGVVYECPDMQSVKVCLFKYDKNKNEASFEEMYDSPLGLKVEKNWVVPYEKNPNFDFIYNCGITIKDGKIVNEQNIKKVKFSGGSCLIDLKDETYLSIAHGYKQTKYRAYDYKYNGYIDNPIRDYYHIFVRYDWYGNVIQCSEPFRFISPGVEFAIGLVEKNNDLIISFGKQDYDSYIGIISKDKVLNLLEDIKDE